MNIKTIKICQTIEILSKPPLEEAKSVSSSKDTYNLCVRLDKDAGECLKDGTLYKAGYKTIKSWIIDCLNSLKDKTNKELKDDKQ